MNIGDKVVLRADAEALLAVSDLEPGAEGVILSEEWIDVYKADDEESDGFFVEFIGPRGLKERWMALTTELELVQ